MSPAILRSSAFVSLAFLLCVAPTALAAPPGGAESVLQPDTVGFLHVRVADVWESPGFAFYRKMLTSLGEEETKSFDGRFVPNPTKIEGLTIVMPVKDVRMPIPDGRPVGDSFLWLVTTKEPIDRVDLVKSLGLEARTKTHRGVEYLFDESHWAGVMQLDPKTLVVAAEDSIVRLIEQREKPQGQLSALADLFGREAGKHTALLAVNPAVFATPEVMKNFPEPLQPLLRATTGWAALDMKQQNTLALNLEFSNPALVAAGDDAVKALRKMAHDLIAQGLKELQNQQDRETKRQVMGLLDMPEHFGPAIGKAALKYLDNSLKDLKVEKNERGLRAELNLSELLPANVDAMAVMSFAAFSVRFGSSYYMNSQSGDDQEIPWRLRDQFDRISAALEAYHKDKGSYPPAATYDKDGKPLLSWRVLILPYMEQRGGDIPPDGDGPFGGVVMEKKVAIGPNGGLLPNGPVQTFKDLYDKFKLDEPWDSLHNKKLIERMPRPFRVDFTANNWRYSNGWKTGIQVLQGPATLFPGKEAKSKGQVRDGLDSTIAVVFRDDPLNAVAWTKPADVPFATDKQVPKLFAVPPGVGNTYGPKSDPAVYVIMADGSKRRLPADLSDKDFKGLATIDGGENVKLPAFERNVKETKKTEEGPGR